MIGENAKGLNLDQDFPPDEEVDIDPEDDENGNQYNISNDGSLTISESNEGALDMNKITAIPILNSQGQFKNKTSKENQQFDNNMSINQNRKNILTAFS